MANKLFAAILFFLIALPFSVGALEMQRGKIKVQINEKNGRFSLFYADDLSNPVFVPMFLTQDPTTSKVKIQQGDKISSLGDDREFLLAVEETPTGAKSTWTSKSLRVVEYFEFLTSASSAVVDGLRITFSLTNIGEATLHPALRFVLDTNLGEKKDHYILSTDEKITGETLIENNLPDYFVSPSATDEKIGLMVMVTKGGTPPSRILFANWKRLDDSPWDIAYRQGREFNLLPYSYNDSAVALYYDAQELIPNQNREIVVMMGNRSAVSFVGAKTGTSSALNDLLVGSRTKDAANLQQALNQDRQSLEDVLKQINEKQQNSSKVTADDLKIIQAILDQLEQRKKLYQSTSP